VVATRVAPADQVASGEGQVHQLPNVGELAHEVERDLGERSLDGFIRIEDHAAAGEVTGRRRHPLGDGLVAFP